MAEHEKNGKFAIGHKKFGGRQKGTQDKKIVEQKNRIDQFFSHHWDEFEEDIWPALSPKDKKDTFIALANYRYPKLSSVDMKAQVSSDNEAVELLRNAVNDSDIV